MRFLWFRRLELSLLVALVGVVPVGAQETHLLVITGLGGSAEYTELFHDWATTLIVAATERYELPSENVTFLGEKPELDPDLIDGKSLRENVEVAIEAIAERASPREHVVIVLFGHGSFSDKARINLPRHDLAAEDFQVLLDKLGSRHVTFVNTASASGPFLEKLSGEGRTVMTATKTGRERNASIFGGHFVDAFADGEEDADQDKNQRVSMLEAFIYARNHVVQTYESEGLLATEHALLDDNGDGQGTDSPDPLGGDSTDGMVARTLFFSGGSGVRSETNYANNSALQALYQERKELEVQVDDLRLLRGVSDADQYQEELERLMIELALTSREIRELEGQQEGAPLR